MRESTKTFTCREGYLYFCTIAVYWETVPQGAKEKEKFEAAFCGSVAVFCYLIPLFEQKCFSKILESSFISLQTLLHAKRDLFCKLQMMIRRLNTSSTARIFVGNVITVSQLR